MEEELSTLSLDRNGSKKTAIIVVGPHSTTRHGDSFSMCGAPLEGPSLNMYIWFCSREASSALSLSLSMEEGRSTFGVMAGIWAKF